MISIIPKFFSYIEGCNSTSDYWKVIVNEDGSKTTKWDGSKDIRDENGNLIHKDETGSWSGSLAKAMGITREDAQQLLNDKGFHWDGSHYNVPSGGGISDIMALRLIGDKPYGNQEEARTDLSKFNVGDEQSAVYDNYFNAIDEFVSNNQKPNFYNNSMHSEKSPLTKALGALLDVLSVNDVKNEKRNLFDLGSFTNATPMWGEITTGEFYPDGTPHNVYGPDGIESLNVALDMGFRDENGGRNGDLLTTVYTMERQTFMKPRWFSENQAGYGYTASSIGLDSGYEHMAAHISTGGITSEFSNLFNNGFNRVTLPANTGYATAGNTGGYFNRDRELVPYSAHLHYEIGEFARYRYSW